MLVLNILLLPMVLAATREVKFDGYIVEIANHTLTKVRMTEFPSNGSLDLSGLGLKSIDSMAFVNVTKTNYLDLGDNSLTDLPESVFSNLHDLEGLSLADNNIEHFTRAFVGLENLKSLNISNNPIRTLEPGELYGLSESVVISTLCKSLSEISTTVFQDLPVRPSPESEPHSNSPFNVTALELIYFGIVDGPLTTDSTSGFKICIEQDKVILLENWSKDEVLSAGCSMVKHSGFEALYMDDLGIVDFAEGWYRITGYIKSMTFRRNRIASLSPQMLNDLPHSVKHVDISENKIERLSAGVISNSHIQFLYLENNLIREIEQGVFENTELNDLRLSGNKLKDTRFVATLPYSLESLHLGRNEIEDVSDFSSVRHPRLGVLSLNDNKITRLHMNSFPLPLVWYLDLSSNHIKTLPPLSFRGVSGLELLLLNDNVISHISDGAFAGLTRLVSLDLGENRLTDVGSFARDLPDSLERLYLDNNKIEELRAGTFVNVPKQLLTLHSNKISKIAKNSFVAPEKYGKDSSFEPNSRLQALNPWWWSDILAIPFSNEVTSMPVRREKGIGVVELSHNPISKLENGVLFGIRLRNNIYIHVSDTGIESIHGGIFDNYN